MKKTVILILLMAWLAAFTWAQCHLLAWIWNMTLPLHIRPAQAFGLTLIQDALFARTSPDCEFEKLAGKIVRSSLALLAVLAIGGLVLRSIL